RAVSPTRGRGGLHAFPTRRSSDLGGSPDDAACGRPAPVWSVRTPEYSARHTAAGNAPDARRSAPAPALHNHAATAWSARTGVPRSEEHTSELQSRENLVCRLLLKK